MVNLSISSIQSWMQDALNDGFKALQENNIREASAICHKLLKSKPDLVEAHFLVGLIALERKDRKTAIQAFGSVTTLDKTHSVAWVHLSKEFIDSGQINRADQALKEAVKYGCDNHVVQSLMGYIYTKLGDYQSAEFWQSKASTTIADNLPYTVNHAYSLLYLGKIEECKAKLKKVFKQLPDHSQSHFILATARKAKTYDHVEELERLTKQDGLQPADSAFLYYALGKEYEDLQEWEKAFSAFENGANARRSIIQYNEGVESTAFEALEKTYTKEWLASQEEGCEDISPVFILGQPRTGSTLIERVISSHSLVHSAGELQQFSMSLRRLADHRDPEWFSSEFISQAAELSGNKIGEMYLKTSEKMRGDLPHFVDKMPSNYRFIPLILKAFPNAKIIHVKRNPMDACFASYKQLFSDAYGHSYDQKEMARHHARYYHLMECWRERFPDRFLDVEYEDVVRDIESNAKKMIDYMDLPWEDGCLDFHKQDVLVATASTVQVREPAHSRSIDRWKKYENQLAPMVDELVKCGIDV